MPPIEGVKGTQIVATDQEKKEVTNFYLRKGSAFRLGKGTPIVKVLALKKEGVSDRKINKLVVKSAEGYGKIAVHYLKKFAAQELRKRNMLAGSGSPDSPKVTQKFLDSFGYFVEQDAGSPFLSCFVFLRYDDEWAWMARYIMGKYGDYPNESFIRENHTQFQFKRARRGQEEKKRRGRGLGKKNKNPPINPKAGNTTHKFSRYVVPIKDKSSGKIVFRSLPLTTQNKWLHPAISKFDFVERAFQEVEKDMELNLKKQYQKLIAQVKEGVR